MDHNVLVINDDLADIDVDMTFSIREIGYLIQCLLMVVEITGDSELIDVYEKMYHYLEPYGEVSGDDDVEDS